MAGARLLVWCHLAKSLLRVVECGCHPQKKMGGGYCGTLEGAELPALEYGQVGRVTCMHLQRQLCVDLVGPTPVGTLAACRCVMHVRHMPPPEDAAPAVQVDGRDTCCNTAMAAGAHHWVIGYVTGCVVGTVALTAGRPRSRVCSVCDVQGVCEHT